MNDFETFAVHAGEGVDAETGALRQPLHMSTTFKLPGFGSKLFDAIYMDSPRPPFAYTRWTNPTLRALEDRLVALEGAEAAVVVASGMAAVSALVFTLLSRGDHLVASEVCYAGSVELFGEYLPRFGIKVSLVDTSDLAQVQAALRPNTRLVYVETPANPILRLADIAALAEIAHAAGAELAVDSTWATPALQKPLALGADYVVHSLTKFINGHGDALGGAVLGSQARIKQIRKDMLVHLGGVLSPFNAWLIQRGLTTLPLRMRQHSQNALVVARFLEDHPQVSRVFYPGLESHPHHELASRQMAGYGGMLTFQLKGGLGAAITLAEKIRLFQYATSLGHAHSLLFYYPTDIYIDSATYLSTEQKQRIRAWTGDGIMRASIGLESPSDLITDLDQALRARTFKGALGPLAYRLLKRLG
ncbi:MAG: aminotransferase class I/II-fold pyridoxal phosphate-dependent enzyme [Anaerolineales bacterium]|nr:aminotransferase class I/II-fold pyridoxal phosphate-dependent enzyme [Anaerolineales bacterium]